MNVCTLSPGRSASERLSAGKVCLLPPVSLVYPSRKINRRNYHNIMMGEDFVDVKGEGYARRTLLIARELPPRLAEHPSYPQSGADSGMVAAGPRHGRPVIATAAAHPVQ